MYVVKIQIAIPVTEKFCSLQGDNGVGPGSYSQALFQSALTGAGWDPAVTPIENRNCGNAACVVAWGSGTKSVASVVLIDNGLALPS
jgi:hypothetical protein